MSDSNNVIMATKDSERYTKNDTRKDYLLTDKEESILLALLFNNTNRQNVVQSNIWSEHEIKTERYTKNDTRKDYLWTDEEESALLKILKKRGIDKSLTYSQFANTLVRPMQEMGSNVTSYQIKLKLKNLRKEYFVLKENDNTAFSCEGIPYYETLHLIFNNTNDMMETDSDDEDYRQNVVQSNIWSEHEIKTMLSIIKELHLAHELSLSSFSLGALRLISKGMKSNGFDQNVEHVKIALLSLKISYIEGRKNLFNYGTIKHCPYYDTLDEIWGDEDLDDYLRHNDAENEISNYEKEKRENGFWSEEETIVLLSSIKELNLIDEAFRGTDLSLSKLHDVLIDSGYVRSKRQIKNKLANLKQSYIAEKRSDDTECTVRRFPFYNLYGSLFGCYFDNSNIDYSNSDNFEKLMFKEDTSANDGTERKRILTWSEEETILLLALVQELNLIVDFKGRMTVEIASKLVAPLKEHGFFRTADQIKIKLKNLRSSYYKCLQAGCTSRALIDCPFYNRLHAIFENRPNKRLEAVKRSETIKSNYGNINNVPSDHTYLDIKNRKDVDNDQSSRIEKLKQSPESTKKKDIWLWVESTKGVIDGLSLDLDENAEYPQSDQESDVSHSSRFKEDDKNIFMKLADQDEDVENLLLEEESYHVTENEEAVDEDQTTNNVTNTFSKQEQKPFSAPISQASSVKRQYSFQCLEERLAKQNKRSYQPTLKSPFTTLLGNKNTSNTTVTFPTFPTSEAVYVKTLRRILSDTLKHEKCIQQQHQIGMEKQFEIQRKHDCEQRDLLLKELRELRRSIVTRLKI